MWRWYFTGIPPPMTRIYYPFTYGPTKDHKFVPFEEASEKTRIWDFINSFDPAKGSKPGEERYLPTSDIIYQVNLFRMQHEFGEAQSKYGIEWRRWAEPFQEDITITLTNNTKQVVILTIVVDRIDPKEQIINGLIKAQLEQVKIDINQGSAKSENRARRAEKPAGPPKKTRIYYPLKYGPTKDHKFVPFEEASGKTRIWDFINSFDPANGSKPGEERYLPTSDIIYQVNLFRMQHEFGKAGRKYGISWKRWYDVPNEIIYLQNRSENIVVLTIELERRDDVDEVYAIIKGRLGVDEDIKEVNSNRYNGR
jgi:hypothetical protein